MFVLFGLINFSLTFQFFLAFNKSTEYKISTLLYFRVRETSILSMNETVMFWRSGCTIVETLMNKMTQLWVLGMNSAKS